MKYHLLIIGFAMSVVLGCKTDSDDSQKSPAIELEKEVIAIHDEVMPRMSDIERLHTTLETELQNTAHDSVYIEAIRESMTALETGDSLMWDWMHNFSKPENVSKDSMMAYLTKEKEKISKVSMAMNSAITAAEGILQKLGHGEPH